MGTTVTNTERLTWGQKQVNVVPFNRNVDKQLPFGPTDLKSAFNAVRRLDPKPKQVLLITDGLPTGTRQDSID